MRCVVISARASASVWSGWMVSGLTTIPDSNFLTCRTCAACSSGVRFLWITPMPPSCAMAIAMSLSVTVSIAAEISGTFSQMLAGEAGAGVGRRSAAPASRRAPAARRRRPAPPRPATGRAARSLERRRQPRQPECREPWSGIPFRGGGLRVFAVPEPWRLHIGRRRLPCKRRCCIAAGLPMCPRESRSRPRRVRSIPCGWPAAWRAGRRRSRASSRSASSARSRPGTPW